MDIANFFVLILIFLGLPPIAPGIIRKIRARAQNRKGPRLLQSLFDVMRLGSKKPVDGVNSGIFAEISPTIALVSSLILYSISVFEWAPFLLIPFFLALQRITLMTFAMETGTSFGGLGSSREILLSVAAEPIIILMIIVAQSKLQMPLSQGSIIIGLAFFAASSVAILAEVKKPPFDDPRTHLELTMVHEAMLLEASGRTFAFFEVAGFHKFCALVVFLIRLSIEHSQLHSWAPLYQNLLVLFGSLFYFGVLGYWESMSVRRKWTWVPETLGLTFLFILILGTLLKLNI
ncbi:formate hydrogenase [Leptospira perolatii]|uniref:Formate hydrogenase n=2 Tax=Leptospira perolatii TaxID=2023191 RepID=A0A2M9ZT06_9LEPT|nr:formate hydrogenase [Leptospira perolatii]PJZ75228.1 formate hydrogenase [Leptospira perolatii]